MANMSVSYLNVDHLIWKQEEVERQSPIEKLYFTGEMLAKYEPCTSALQTVIESQGEDEEAWDEFQEHFEKFLNFSWCSTWDGTTYDLVFYGVSGYTGYLMMEYLKRVSTKRNPENFTFAFAGRTPSKVAEMRDREFVGTEFEDTAILQASFDDPVSMIDLAKSARVIINVAGPYMLSMGEVLVDACTRYQCDYVDVSGEIPWSLRLMDLHKQAKEAKVSICPSSAVAGGYPDLLVYLASRALQEQFGEETRRATCYCFGGGASAASSGGTLATRAAMSSSSDEVRKAMADPFSLGGFIPDIDRHGFKEAKITQGTGHVTLKTRKEDGDAVLSKVTQDPTYGFFRGPHVYAYFDNRIVRRSNMLLADISNQPYGRELCFQEFAIIPPDVLMNINAQTAKGSSSAADEQAALMADGKYYAPGDGPPLEEVADAWISQFMVAETATGNSYQCAFNDADGYFATARVAVETAMTLRFDKENLKNAGGVLTCTVAGENYLATRIINAGAKFKAGSWFEMDELGPPPGALG